MVEETSAIAFQQLTVRTLRRRSSSWLGDSGLMKSISRRKLNDVNKRPVPVVAAPVFQRRNALPS